MLLLLCGLTSQDEGNYVRHCRGLAPWPAEASAPFILNFSMDKLD